MNHFIDKVVIITDKSSGIGLATAQAFESEGAKVVVTGCNAETLASAAKVLSKETLTAEAEVTKSADIARLVNLVREKHGHTDLAIDARNVTQLGVCCSV
ncbi:SDR family NAD(P)-dependent oxidoreductase [Synechocystis sp. PCC 7509]|uniref:SDR family NAD(P)-dependent oxidoreductase n=1 Tax=Synechocystis sp. PCC 7509 TaxID=927677 RepID=UPI0002AC7E9B|nr:SDR family NAD(P)-dependent oxidoreductase [Synechocystis sp. PCC 7509]